jgi:hypothetical protein
MAVSPVSSSSFLLLRKEDKIQVCGKSVSHLCLQRVLPCL